MRHSYLLSLLLPFHLLIPSANAEVLDIRSLVNALPISDISWIEVSRDCDDFAGGVLKTFSSIAPSEQGGQSEEEVAEMRRILEAACKPPFDTCNFSICNKAGAPLGTPEPSLTWIRKGMNCNEFLSELRTRYQNDKLAASEDLRKELRTALNVACSPEFAECKFEACSRPE